MARVSCPSSVGCPHVLFVGRKDVAGHIFCPVGERTEYAGQAVAVVLADSHATAIKAAKHVKITYKNETKPILDVRKIIKDGPADRIKQVGQITPTSTKTNIKHVIKGSWDIASQYHYTMETHTCFAVMMEDHMEVYPSSQSPTSIQTSISYALNLPGNDINIRVRRVGGGYGAKLTRCNHVAVVTALCAYLSRKPVKIVLQMENNMKWAGKRFPVLSDYEVGVDDNGEIQYLNASLWQDNGYCPNDSAIGGTINSVSNIYDSSTWKLTGYEVTTDTPSNTWCRAPGTTEAIALIETIMDHIACVIGQDPVHVRLANLDKVNSQPIPGMINETAESANYQQRLEDVAKFNKENRWKKRGISLVPMNYPFGFWGGFHGLVSIFGADGTVAVMHGAVEMGQGVNTKVAQVVAYTLGIDVDLISVKPFNNNTAPNDSPTGGSIGSEAVSYAVKVCCDQLNERLAPIKKQLGPNASWKEITKAALDKNIDLLATHQFTNRDLSKSYFIYGVTIAEVEVDILTGQLQIRRVDLNEDAGQSLSPDVDIGQIEGAFIMGAGYYTSEEIVYDPDSGINLTDRTWNYKPPGAKDIPLDFRVTLKKNSDNPFGVLRSKATGEPPLCMTVSVPNAIRNAILSARKDAGISDPWLALDAPYTAEKIWLAASTKKEQMVIS
ncbi:Molybdopterin-Hypothetical protein domain of aldehyde dehydrogenase [Nesidiocoris tenuis]|uniref:Aldehyde oxidase/xanthine dehydrogenase a/b hammerhead domain-containing protein n=1 Tax=Nesidiocoris tenuis TaxID=355587 RepID=A0ABN7B2L9_9HEMI|nr:Molybdopterin-Hypothetical protein domain of aldehyde dehydrogenase [Nesidiocoris tenuis]